MSAPKLYFAYIPELAPEVIVLRADGLAHNQSYFFMSEMLRSQPFNISVREMLEDIFQHNGTTAQQRMGWVFPNISDEITLDALTQLFARIIQYEQRT